MRRLGAAPGFPVEATLTTGGNPDGVTVADGTVWVTIFNQGTVARFPATAPTGNVTPLAPSGGTLPSPFGIAPAPEGGVYVTGRNTVARVSEANASSSSRHRARMRSRS